ncbi:sugar transporter ERD6-like 7 isoform X1 [Amaranthus tricolor]|uniref:sugar transporter ERD6-like 7 isoform X1 n=1 Tax=Amaranthus tricolor TaxID=29722 RepID=UPI00258458CB|nr:sugar transporter ERD6-like 7 isoform X1 [Amaranthus tricolor]
MVYISTGVAVCGSYQFGACAGYTSPTQTSITSELDLSTAEFSLFGSILTFGAMFGAITSGPISDSVCRIWAMRVYAACCIAGWLAIYFSKSYMLLDIGRTVGGYGMGAFSFVVPVYNAEIAPANIRGALTTINQIGIEEIKQHSKASIYDLLQKKYLCSVIIGVGLMVLQRFGGINGICYYASNIFETAGFSSKIGTIIYSLLQVLVPSIGATLIDKAGRKPLLLISVTGSALGCLLTATAFYLKLYISSYSVGIGPVPWTIMSEIFPINVKGIAGSLATHVNWLGAWVVSYTFNFLMEWNSYGTFLLFGVINALGIIFVINVMPETNGRTLEQIQHAVKG